MNQRALDEMRHRTGMDSWLFYVWAIPCTVGEVFLTWLTFHNGILVLLTNPEPFLIWIICTMVLVSLWRARPKKKQGQIRLNL
jgi:hypothetical protein